MICKLFGNTEKSSDNSELLARFHNFIKQQNKWSLCFTPLVESCDYTHFLNKVLCAYISSSYWKFTVMRSVAVGLAADGMVRIEIWLADEVFEEIYLKKYLCKIVSLDELAVEISLINCIMRCADDTAKGRRRTVVSLIKDLGFTSFRSRVIPNSSVDYYPVRLNEMLHKDGDITFAGELDPEDGWALVLVGGSASGKSVFLNKISFRSKIFDVDDFKKAYNTAIRVKQQHPEWAPRCFTNGDSRLRNLRDPQEAAELHEIVKKAKLSERQQELFFNNLAGILPNVTFDITGYDTVSLRRLFQNIKGIRLKSDTNQRTYRTSLCLIATSRDLAILNNLSRARIVPEADFHKIHNGVLDGVISFLRFDAVDVDEAWIYFSPQNDAKLAKENPELALWVKDNRFICLQKQGSGFKITNDLEKKVRRILGEHSASVEYAAFDDLLLKGISDNTPQGRELRRSILRGDLSLHRKKRNM